MIYGNVNPKYNSAVNKSILNIGVELFSYVNTVSDGIVLRG